MTDHFKTQGRALLANGYSIVPILKGEKRPSISGWQKSALGLDDLDRYPGQGVGVLCGQGALPIIGVDIDISHPAISQAVIAWCHANLGNAPERVGAAPRVLLVYRAASSGWGKSNSVQFFDESDPVKLNGKRNEQQVEILGHGQQFVAYHEHPDTHRDYEWVDMFEGIVNTRADQLPLVTEQQIDALLAEVMRLVRATPSVKVTGSAESPAFKMGGDDLLSLSATVGTSIADITALLAYLPNDGDDYDMWLKVGMALNHEYRNTPHAAEALALWQQYGARSSKDVPNQYAYKWRSFGSNSSASTTLRWLLKITHQAKRDSDPHLKYRAKAEWMERLNTTVDEFTLRETICPQIMLDDRLDEMTREALSQSVYDAFRRLGNKYPIMQCRKLLAKKRSAKQWADQRLPDWVQKWVYVTDVDLFYRIDSEEWLSLQGFNAKFNRELSENGERGMQSAAWSALTDMGIPSVTRAVYLPWAAAMFEKDGVACVNTYRPSSTPAAAQSLSAAGQDAVGLVLQHLNLLAGSRKDIAATLTDWLAHNVQNPGIKVRWAPLLRGVEGDGKSLLGSLLASVMGRVNVRNVSPKVLGTDFTGWAEGSCVAVLEEIKLTGHNRYDILNALKPFITNDSIEVHSKGKDARNAINTTNYIAFTNYGDALPLTDTDRRWWIVFTPFASSTELAATVADLAPSLGEYFDRLHEAIQQHPSELRRWLLDYQISASFKHNGSAPPTPEKLAMISLSASDDEDTVRDVLENCEGLEGITKTMFSSRSMLRVLTASNIEINLNTTASNKLYIKVGFTKLPKKVKWGGSSHTIWVKGYQSMETEQVRVMLDATLKYAQKGF